MKPSLGGSRLLRALLAGTAVSTLVVLSGGGAVAAARPAPRPGPYQRQALAAAQRSTGAHALLTSESDAGEDPEEIAEQAEQWAEARSAPGLVAPGAYSAAWAQQQALPVSPGRCPCRGPTRAASRDHASPARSSPASSGGSR